MGLSTILIISLAAGVVLVVGGGVMMYMANLVKSAYEIKVQINSEVDERLTKMGDDLDKKSRWMRRDLGEEIDKIRQALTSENTKKFNEMTEPLLRRVDQVEQALRAERAEWVKAVEADRAAVGETDGRIRALRRDVKRLEDRLGLAAGSDTMPAPDLPGAKPAPGEAPSAAAQPSPAQQPQPGAPQPGATPSGATSAAGGKPPAKPGGPVSVSSILQELGNS